MDGNVPVHLRFPFSRYTICICSMSQGPSFDKDFHNFKMTTKRSSMQRCRFPSLRYRINLRTVLQEQLDKSDIAQPRGVV
mmetsp:Transcript_22489/g.38585  ORF Transcript_22489/g.38585 Transcript_22489/m.38585 type:complete len:80 (+) Transcript_22489:722-961(+)